MKKLVSIAFLSLFLFYVGGYYVVYLGLRYKACTEMAMRLDQDRYSDEETTTIKIPYSLPYQAEGDTFERMGGEFEHHGEFYKLVKQKVENDTLYIVCIKDKKEKTIFNFMADMVRISTDLPASSPSMKLLTSLIKDYLSASPVAIVSEYGWSSDVAFVEQQFNVCVKSFPVFSPPPESFS